MGTRRKTAAQIFDAELAKDGLCKVRCSCGYVHITLISDAQAPCDDCQEVINANGGVRP